MRRKSKEHAEKAHANYGRRRNTLEAAWKLGNGRFAGIGVSYLPGKVTTSAIYGRN